MAKPHSPRGLSSREHIACAIGILSGVSLLMMAAAEPAWAQLRPTDASNSVLIDLSVIEGAAPAARLGGAIGPAVGVPTGNLLLPPSAPPESRLLTPNAPAGAARVAPPSPSVTLRPPAPESRREVRRDAQPKAAVKGASKGGVGSAPRQPVERREEAQTKTAQRTPLPDVALPTAPTPLGAPQSAAPTPPPAVSPPEPPQQQAAAAPPPAAPKPAPKTTPKSEPSAKAPARSTAPTPPPAIEAPKPPEATPPPPAAATAPPPPAQQQAALPERAPRPPASAPAPESMEIRFAAGDANLPQEGRARLDKLTESLKANENSRLQLLAYAGEDQISPSKARRLSLSRALAVRSYLIAKGIRSTRIDVRALGDQVPGGDPNRVDLKVADR